MLKTIRPALQARRKLIFLYLLRSSSALATSEPTITMNVGSTKSSSPIPALKGSIQLRLATRQDVPSIQRCNLATLPENYSSNFYVNHLRQWPDLALVAEHVVEDPQEDKHREDDAFNNPFNNYDASKPQNEIVGYVLGKVEETAIAPPSSFLKSKRMPSKVVDSDEYFQEYYANERKTEMLGHVTSLAVLPTFRRRGLAAQLMKQLHFHMDEGHHADGVGLHVRVSNVAARRLYCEGMGYGVVDVIRGYYQDGEDAFFMRKDFPKRVYDDYESEGQNWKTNTRSSTLSRFSLSRMRSRNIHSNAGVKSSVWKHGPKEFRLPRIIVRGDDTEQNNQNDIIVPALDIEQSEEKMVERLYE
jgi:peptide alpha-N-acetyltransferase